MYATRSPTPSWMKSAPVIWPALAPFYSAFCELSTERAIGFSVGAIPWSKVMEYADRYGYDGLDRQDLLYLIRSMDRAYLEFTAEKKPSTPPPPPTPKGGPITSGKRRKKS